MKDNPNLEVSALCVTSGTLINQVRQIALSFSVSAKEELPFQNFPHIKCKVLPDGQRRYYTPNDNEYATAQIITANGDFFCHNVNDTNANP